MTPRHLVVSRLGAFVTVTAVVAFVAAGAATAAAQSADVSVRASVDRTALFVGDRATYTIELTCGRGVELLPDDLSGDRLKLDGLELVASDSSRAPGRESTTVYRFRYVLTTYRVDVPTLRLGSMVVRYARTRPGQRVEDAVPAGEVRIPGEAIAFRSALADEQDVSGIRADRPADARPAVFGMLQPVGIGLAIVSIVPAALAASAVVGRRRAHLAKAPRRSARTVRQAERASVEAVRAMDFSSLDGRREAFTRLDTLVREHVRDVCGVPGPSLTSAEIASALSTRAAKVPVELVTSVLVACERARYAPPHATPSADACRQTIDDVDQVIGIW
ncbi:MAG: hypothetical protein HYZ58_05530 [Acidobacteria bacterium]|nr:hypothetical protein [Acidobacteriota bacterium]MBI3262595.1 hypothetical protein [Acidobacteriota bacterium]